MSNGDIDIDDDTMMMMMMMMMMMIYIIQDVFHSLESTLLALNRNQEVPSDIPMEEDDGCLLLVVSAVQRVLCSRWRWAKSTFPELPTIWKTKYII